MTITINIPEDDLIRAIAPLLQKADALRNDNPGCESSIALTTDNDRAVIEARAVNLEDEPLSRRAINNLRVNEIHTLEDLARCEKRYLMGLRNMGRKMFEELEYYIIKKGYRFGQFPPIWRCHNSYGVWVVRGTDGRSLDSRFRSKKEAEDMVNELNSKIL